MRKHSFFVLQILHELHQSLVVSRQFYDLICELCDGSAAGWCIEVRLNHVKIGPWSLSDVCSFVAEHDVQEIFHYQHLLDLHRIGPKCFLCIRLLVILVELGKGCPFEEPRRQGERTGDLQIPNRSLGIHLNGSSAGQKRAMDSQIRSIDGLQHYIIIYFEFRPRW